MRYRLILFLIFGAILVGLGEWDAQTHRFHFSDGLNDKWLEFCVANSRDKINDPAVSLVRINDKYEPAIGNSLTHADYAAIMSFVEKFDPKAVAFEPNPVFDPAEPMNQTTLELLKEAALTLPPLTLGSVAENGQAPQSPAEEPKFPLLTKVEGDLVSLTPFTRVVATPDPQLLANGQMAFTGIELAGDASASDGGRRINLIARHGDKVVPSFVIHALANMAGVPLDQVVVQLPPAVRSGVIRIGDAHEIPIDAKGRMKIYEHSGITEGDQEGFAATYPSVSAFDLALTGDEDETIRKLLSNVQASFDSLKTNLVVIGHDRKEDRRENLSNLSRPLSRAEVLTRAIATIQSGRYIDWWPFWGRLLSVLVIFAFARLAFRRSRSKAIVWALMGMFFYFALSMLIFKSTLAWAPAFAPLSLFVLMVVVAIVAPDPTKAGADARAEPPAGTKLAPESAAT